MAHSGHDPEHPDTDSMFDFLDGDASARPVESGSADRARETRARPVIREPVPVEVSGALRAPESDESFELSAPYDPRGVRVDTSYRPRVPAFPTGDSANDSRRGARGGTPSASRTQPDGTGPGPDGAGPVEAASVPPASSPAARRGRGDDVREGPGDKGLDDDFDFLAKGRDASPVARSDRAPFDGDDDGEFARVAPRTDESSLSSGGRARVAFGVAGSILVLVGAGTVVGSLLRNADPEDFGDVAPVPPPVSSASDPVAPEAVSLRTLGERFREELAALEGEVADGRLEAADAALDALDPRLYGYGASEFDALRERVATLRASAGDAGDADAMTASAAAESAASEEAERARLAEAELAAAEAERRVELERRAAAAAASARAERAEAERLAAEAGAARTAELERLAEARRLAREERDAAVRAAAERDAAERELVRAAEARAADALAEAERVAEAEREAAARAAGERAAAEAERVARIESDRAEAAARAVREREARIERAERDRAEAVARARREREALAATRVADERAAAERAVRDRAEARARAAADARALADERAAREAASSATATPPALAERASAPEPRAITDADLEEVYGRFRRLENAIEARDIAQVIALTDSSTGRVQRLMQAFANADAIDASLSGVATRRAAGSITGTLRIDALRRADGTAVAPPADIASITLISRRAGNGWSVIDW